MVAPDMTSDPPRRGKVAVDTSDLPEAADWSKGVRGRFYRPIKQSVTIRLDADVVEWFKARANKGRYQASINQALREYMEHSR
jgi:uncharacterized protein (DUF4415 family)